MRKNSLVLMLIIILTLLIPANTMVLGASTSLKASFNASTNTLNLSGYATGLSTVVVTSGATAISGESLTGLGIDNIVDFDQFDAPGDISGYSLALKAGVPAGKYKVYIRDIDGLAGDDFILYSKSEADAIVASFPSDKTLFISQVESNDVAMQLGLDLNDGTHSMKAAPILYALYGTEYKSDGNFDSDVFREKYDYCNTLGSLTDKNQAQIETILEDNASVFNINYDDDYVNNEALTTSIKASVCSKLSSMFYPDAKSSAESITGESDMKAIITAYAAVAALSQTSDPLGLETIYNEGFSFLKDNIVDANPDYAKKNPDAVYTALNDETFNDISDLKANFDKAVAKTPDKQTSATPTPPPTVVVPGNSSSSSSGSGGGTFIVPPAASGENEEIPKDPSEQNPDDTSSDKVGGYVPSLSYSEKDFADVAPDSWYKKSVSSLGASDIISGDANGLFRPDDSITRAEFTKLIVAAFSVTGPKKTFTDVPTDAWYFDYVSRASGAGLVSGFEGNFNPENKITRQDAIVILERTANLCGVQNTGFKAFDDMNDVALYAWNAVGTFYYNGLVSGKDGKNFYPNADVTRAEAAQMIYNFIADAIDR